MRSLLILSGFFSFLNGQNFYVTTYSKANGLPSNTVRHVVQDTFGFLWIATDNGLVRFDGTSFRSYAQHLPSQYGRYFYPTSEGFLYSPDAGVSLIQPGLDSSRIELYLKASIDPEDDALYYSNQIFRHQNGTIWVYRSNHALTGKEIEVLLYDKPVLDYLIDKLQLSNKVSLLPVNFNKQYKSFFLPKNSPHLSWVNPLLVRKINEASWQDMLKKYNLHGE